jgi:hypothetical protein
VKKRRKKKNLDFLKFFSAFCFNIPAAPILKHPDLGIQLFFFGLRINPFSPSVWKQESGFYIIFQMNTENDVAHDRYIVLGHREKDFDPVVKVAGHKVGASQEDFLFSAIPEIIYS